MRQMLRAGALGRPREMGWRGRREGGSGWGTHVNPWLIHVNVWQKPLQYCKVSSLQVIKINGEKNKNKNVYGSSKKNWLYFPCCTSYLVAYFIHNTLYLLTPYPYVAPPPSLSPVVITSLFSVL